MQKLGRLDAIIYDREYKEKINSVLNYKYGIETPTQMGFEVIPGPSLEIKIIRTRIDSDEPKKGFYTLLLPKNISKYGTINLMQYMGTSKRLPLLKNGDILFGEAGFLKGRSIVLVDLNDRYTTNAHGLYARRKDPNIIKSIFFRCIFNWYRKMRLIDIMAVGGSGGHFSPSYFDDYLRIPKFPKDKQEMIARLYHNPKQKPSTSPTRGNLIERHREYNAKLGILELDKDIKNLKNELRIIQEKIIKGRKVVIQLN